MTERKRERKSLADQVKRTSKSPAKKTKEILSDILIPTGSTMLNLSCSDNPDAGYRAGSMVNLIGDSSSGKTFQALTMLAEICQLERFNNYRLIYDDVEAACEFDISYLFGDKTAERIESPAKDKEGLPLNSDVVEDFHCYIMDAIEGDQPFIYILDSADALGAEQDEKKVDEMRVARRKGQDTAGSYAMAKPKAFSSILRGICAKLKKGENLLLIVSQTRDNIDPMSFSKKTRSGGKALKFYATHEIWMACAKTHKKKERAIGVDSKLKITKNKLTGKKRECEFPIFYDYGIDDIGSCIDFLVKEKVWYKKKLTIQATTLGLEGTRASLINQIEDKGLEGKLRRIVGKAWREIEDSLKLNRKSKYE